MQSSTTIGPVKRHFSFTCKRDFDWIIEKRGKKEMLGMFLERVQDFELLGSGWFLDIDKKKLCFTERIEYDDLGAKI